MVQYSSELRYVENLQHSSYDESVMELVENSEVYPDLDSFCRASALKGHKDVLVEIVCDSFYLYNITYLQLRKFSSFQPLHYIDEKNKMYHMAKEQARLHEEFDAHVSTGALDHFICKGDALNAILDDDIIHSRFSVLDHTLIKLSFERRAILLGRQDQLSSYYQHLRQVVHNEQLRIGLQSLMCELEAEGFFSIVDDSIDWVLVSSINTLYLLSSACGINKCLTYFCNVHWLHVFFL
ncbi:uncharacterized protein [Triticum aestivum]|uniref:uncharacterized protein n=1 Tax=Triticum aestivum TaxID=4565 RepID=UPI001D020B92|nr:uncharacterized protein LOC123150408 [Triticum aestivum]